MHQNRHQMLLRTPMEPAFAAIAVAHRVPGEAGEAVRPGRKFRRREGGIDHYARLIDCQPPVLLVLRELWVAPWPILRVYYRYRLEPQSEGTRLMLDVRVTLFPPGRLRPRAWRTRVDEALRRRLTRVRLAAEGAASASSRQAPVRAPGTVSGTDRRLA